MPSFHDRLRERRPLILDGATGTELSRRGVDLSHPSWTAGAILEQPEILAEIHRDYVEAGAELITANTFRTHRRNLAEMTPQPDPRELTLQAIRIAREATNGRALIAGSIAPLEDCYSPQLTPENSSLLREHREMAEHLAEADVDVILIETQVTIREAATAAQAAAGTGLPFLVSFVLNREGRLLSGETLEAACAEVIPFEPSGLLVNCLPPGEVARAGETLLRVCGDLPIGAYANTGRLLPDGTWEATEGVEPAVYAGFARGWWNSGMKLIGGCCGTTPDHISAIRAIL